MVTVSTSSNRVRQPAAITRQLLAIVIATLAATIANVIYYFVLKNIFGVPFVALEQFPPPEVSPLPVADVVLFSLIYAIGASMVFLLVANTARNPAKVFTLICTVVLLLSLYLPMRAPTPPIPIATKISMSSMHVLGAVVLVPLLIIIALPRSTKKEAPLYIPKLRR